MTGEGRGASEQGRGPPTTLPCPPPPPPQVINVTGPEAAEMQKQGWTVLDVRPPSEATKVPVVGAVQVREGGEV